MAVKLVLYKLQYVNDPDAYEKRRKSLLEAISAQTSTFWDEPTSSVLMQFPGSATDLFNYLMQNSYLHEDGRDMLVVIDLATKDQNAIGVRDKKLDVLLALAKGRPNVPPATGIGGSSAVAAALASPPKNRWGQ
ncbi:MAG: hypothetical protein IR164_05700 [Devosia sp.]|uniref:hypothetical protein n=1 Tax=Devosia sp. TaxID=1871048 RepID=UPI001A0A9D45|nr:hypothetical protein [Devosia sp.]MBF0678420.1 hypothetical protein [Devosia sp.]